MVRLVPAPIRLVLDIVTIKCFVRAFGWNGELLDSHLFFFDRYSELADWCAAWGLTAQAERLRALAEAHCQLAPDDDDPPEAAAVALPLPESYEAVEAIGQRPSRRRAHNSAHHFRLLGGKRASPEAVWRQALGPPCRSSLVCGFFGLLLATTFVRAQVPSRGTALEALQTRAERSGFTETSRYDDVMTFLRTVDDASPIVHATSFGKAFEGRSLPLAVVGRVGDARPETICARSPTPEEPTSRGGSAHRG